MKLLKSKIPWGATATLTGEGLSRVAMSAFQFLIANGLGPNRYGTLGIALAFASILLPFADLGLNALALRFLSNNRDPFAFQGLSGLKLVSTLLYLFVLGLCVFLNPNRNGHSFAWIMAGIFLALTSLADFFRQSLRAREASRIEFQMRFLYFLLFIPAGFIFWKMKPGIAGTLLIYCLPALGLALLYTLPLRRVFQTIRPDFEESRKLLVRHRGFIFQAMLYLLLTNLSTRIDLWLIDWGAGRSAVGFYFAAYNLIFSGTFFAQALSVHMYPNLQRPGNRAWRLGRALLAHGGLAFVSLTAILLWGGVFYALVFRGAGYHEGLLALPRLGILLSVSIFNYLWLSIFIGRHKQWIASLALIAIIAIKFNLGRLWVPVQGVEGMLRASLWAEIPVSMIAGMIACWLFLRDRTLARD